MASVPLDFTPPEEPNITTLHIFESPTQTGSFTEIESVTPIGVYPNYITRYTTTVATSLDYWFAIQWEDALGALSPMSMPVQGGTETLVNKVVSRVLLRDPSVNEIIATQEAEAVIEQFYGGQDPYTVDQNVSYSVLSGLTLITMARSIVMSASVTTTGGKWVAGIVSMDNSSTSKFDPAVLLVEAKRFLGISESTILQLSDPNLTCSFSRLRGVDLSRSILEIDVA